jgi:putative MATE family efflux protein
MLEGVRGATGRGVVAGRDWTKGSIIRNLLSLSWPMMVHESFYMVGQVVDMIWVGRLGSASIAGVGIASIIAAISESAIMGLVVGMTAMIARFMGAGDTSGANHVARQSFIISFAYGAVTTAVAVSLARPIIGLFGLEAAVVTEGVAYMRTLYAGSLAMSFWFMSLSIMRASGDSMIPMRISIFVRCIHVLLDPFLIFGWWIFPRMGVSGAALGNVVAQTLGMTISLWVLFSGRTRLRLTMRNFRIDPGTIWRIVKIGIPAGVMSIQRAFGDLLLAWLLVPFGTLAVAAHSLYQRVMMVLFLPSWSLGMGSSVLVGQNLGAQQPERSKRTGWLATGIVEAIMLVASVAILLWAEEIVHIFTSEPDLVQIASIFLRIATAGFIVSGLTTVLQQSISGAGDTIPPMIIGIVIVWAVQLPLAYFLPQATTLGVYGVRWAIVAGMVVGAVAYALYFKLGRWKRKRV